MSTLERLNSLEIQVGQLRSYAAMLQNQVAELTANNAHLGKMLMATVETLITSNVIQDGAVMSRITQLEDEQTKDHISQMLKLNAIVKMEEGNEKSVFILKQVKDGEVVSNYYLAPFAKIPQEVANQLVGAKPGFKFTHNDVESEVLEIYNQAE